MIVGAICVVNIFLVIGISPIAVDTAWNGISVLAATHDVNHEQDNLVAGFRNPGFSHQLDSIWIQRNIVLESDSFVLNAGFGTC